MRLSASKLWILLLSLGVSAAQQANNNEPIPESINTTTLIASPANDSIVLLKLSATSTLNDQKIAYALVQAYANASLSVSSNTRRRRSTGALIADSTSGLTIKVLVLNETVTREFPEIKFYVIEEATASNVTTVVAGAYVAGVLQSRSNLLMGFLRDQGIVTTEVNLVADGACRSAREFLAIDLRVLNVSSQADAAKVLKQSSFSRRIEAGLSYVESMPDPSTCSATGNGGCRFTVCKISPDVDCHVTVTFLPLDTNSMDSEPMPIRPPTKCNVMNGVVDMQLYSFAVQAFVRRTTYYYPEIMTTAPPAIAETTFESTAETTFESTAETTFESTFVSTLDTTFESSPETTFESTVASFLPTTINTLIDTTTVSESTSLSPIPPEVPSSTIGGVDTTDSVSCPSVILTQEIYPGWLIALTILFGVLFLVLLIILLIIIGCWCWKRKSKGNYSLRNEQPPRETFVPSDPITTPKEEEPNQRHSDISSPPPPPVALDPFPVPEARPVTTQRDGSNPAFDSEVTGDERWNNVVENIGDGDLTKEVIDDEDVADLATTFGTFGKGEQATKTPGMDNESNEFYPIVPFEGYDSPNEFEMKALPELLFEEDTTLAVDPISATGDVNQSIHVERLPPITHNAPVTADYTDAQQRIDDILAPPPPSVFDQLDNVSRRQRSFDLPPPSWRDDDSPPDWRSSPSHHSNPGSTRASPRDAPSTRIPGSLQNAFNITSPHAVLLFNPTFSPPEPHGIAMPAIHGRNSSDPQPRFPHLHKDLDEEPDP